MFDIQTIEKFDEAMQVDIRVTILALINLGLVDAQYESNRQMFLDKSGTWDEPVEDLSKRLTEFRVKQGLLTEIKQLALSMKEK